MRQTTLVVIAITMAFIMSTQSKAARFYGLAGVTCDTPVAPIVGDGTNCHDNNSTSDCLLVIGKQPISTTIDIGTGGSNCDSYVMCSQKAARNHRECQTDSNYYFRSGTSELAPVMAVSPGGSKGTRVPTEYFLVTSSRLVMPKSGTSFKFVTMDTSGQCYDSTGTNCYLKYCVRESTDDAECTF